jgi:hypothetical protein
VKMGQNASVAVRSRAAFNAGESWSRKSVRNQYITLGLPIINFRRYETGALQQLILSYLYTFTLVSPS